MYRRFVCVCLCVCVIISCVQKIASYVQTLMKFCREGGRGPGRNRLDFGGDRDSLVNPGSFSRFRRKLAVCSVSQQVMNGF